jgi:hypothetical protein
MNWCLATQFLTEVGTAVLVKKAKNILRYLGAPSLTHRR